ncbi:hypothetical protein [Pelagibius sp. Alg239-R121]|uniref:hypothetical protein n=1 Tax=Pelagibius sp. Alg239-R121 TaxID=2993448 RepID=UPI0024A7149D|nr:hypothetical protein [Pelagibius sp. Alg239-R121]
MIGCIGLINDRAALSLVLITIISALAVGWHVWMTRRLSFSSFEDDAPDGDTARNVHALVRLLLPLGVLAIVAAATPILLILASPDLEDALSNGNCTQFIKFPWSWLLPVRGDEVAIMTAVMTNAILSIVLYWTMGVSLWIAKR